MNSRIYVLGTFLLLAIVLSIPVAVLSAQDDANQEQQNIELARRAIEEVKNGGTNLTIETVEEIYAPFVRLHGHNTGGSVINDSTGNILRTYGEALLDNWPDLEIQIENFFASGDLVMVHTIHRGTFEGYISQQNPILPGTALEPDGEHHEWEFVYMFRIEDGKIVEEWRFWNTEMTAAHAP